MPRTKAPDVVVPLRPKRAKHTGNMKERLEFAIFETLDALDTGEIPAHQRHSSLSAIARCLEHFGLGAHGDNDVGVRGSAGRRYAKAFRAKTNAPGLSDPQARRDPDDESDTDPDDAA